jgi:hypothetical protein
MKSTIVIALFAAAVLAAGCDKKGDDDSAKSTGKEASGSADSTGVKECDDYFAMLDKCAKGSPASKGAFDQSKKAMKDSLDAAGSSEAKKAMASSCKTAADALKSNPACN